MAKSYWLTNSISYIAKSISTNLVLVPLPGDGIDEVDHGRGNEKWRDPPPEEKFNQCLRHWRGHLVHSMPPITPWMVTKPTVQTVGGTLKLLYKARGVT